MHLVFHIATKPCRVFFVSTTNNHTLYREDLSSSFFFFFSSRRRHTRCSRDWSSDVCSSDLPPPFDRFAWATGLLGFFLPFLYVIRTGKLRMKKFEEQFPDSLEFVSRSMQIGRASCRERV